MKNLISIKSTLKEAIQLIDTSKHEVLFCIDGRSVLAGSISDGDVRRYMLTKDNVDLNTSVSLIMNKEVFTVLDNEIGKIDIGTLLTKYKTIPVIDSDGIIVRVLSNSMRYFNIEGVWNIDNPLPYVIAEIGNNHNGSIKEAIKLIEAAHSSGANCAKFQMRTMKELYNTEQGSHDLGTEYTLDLLNRFQLSDSELIICFEKCKELGMMPLCTPWDRISLQKLESYGMQAYKVASADFTNHEFLKEIVKTNKPLFISTGMSTEDEITETVAFLDSLNAQYILLHCNSTYPTPFKDINLKYLKRLKTISNGYVGYSGHERDINVAVAAVALGAKVIEKHFTFDRSQEGNDHTVSLLPHEFEKMILAIKQVSESLGNSQKRLLTQGELINRENLAKSIVAKKNIKKGDIIKKDTLDIRSPGQGLQPNKLSKLIGRKANRDILKGTFFYDSDINDEVKEIPKFTFERPYGVPVRYHDFNELAIKGKVDFVEFHLSYKDLEKDLEKIFVSKNPYGYSVHAPELFERDHILDLTSENQDYLEESIKNLQRTINVSRGLRKYFDQKEDPILIVNIGGWSSEDFLNKEYRQEKYKRLSKVLSSMDTNGITLSIQTMPPFPWHFGGQQFHNLFVRPDEIVNFCGENNIGICLDISHSMMASSHLGIDFIADFYDKTAPYVNYMHIVDADGVDGEGVQIGQGDVPFERLIKRLNETLPNTAFVPEVWQGHKDRGAGFWDALIFLSKKGLK